MGEEWHVVRRPREGGGRGRWNARVSRRHARVWQVHDEKRDKFEFVDFLTLIHKDLNEGAPAGRDGGCVSIGYPLS